MDKGWMKLLDRFSEEYRAGVDAFIAFAYQHNGDGDRILCPCLHCVNISLQTAKLVRTHLILYGIQRSYTKWIFHGEEIAGDENVANEPLEDEEEVDEFDGFDAIQDLLGDIHRAESCVDPRENQIDGQDNNNYTTEAPIRFDNLLRNAQCELYPGCKSHSVLSFLLKLVHLKDSNHWSNKSFEMLLKLLKDALPTGDSLPATYYEAKKMLRDGKITGLKTHDYHILLQRILALGMRGFLPEDICDVLLQLGSFFRQLCSKTLRLDVIDKLEQQIIFVLCKMEMIFPPAFFDLMVHLTVHLPQQARLGGPVQFRWMYFVERFLGTLKSMVTNKAHPEGSIAKSFSMKECSTYCSMYLHGIETRFNREERNYDGENQLNRFSVFSTRFRAFGHKDEIILTQNIYDSLSWYVLNNCEEIQQYLDEHEDALIREGAENILDRQRKEFPTWLCRKTVCSI